jgi:hypothetical protein
MKLFFCLLSLIFASATAININLRATVKNAPLIHPMKGHFIDLTVQAVDQT